MATSGNPDFNLIRNEIISEAFAILRVASAEEPMTDEMVTDANRSLNMLVKSWQADGLHLWCKTEGVLMLQPGQQSYIINSTTTDHACLASALAQTTLSADVISGASSISVESASGIADNYYIGIQLDDGTLQWTAVNGGPAGTTVSLDATLTGAASEGNFVYSYETKLVMPRRVIDARRRNNSGIDVPALILERPDYFAQANKASSSYINQIYYDRQLTQGVMYVWPTATTVQDTLRFTFERPMDAFDDPENDPDLPQEWIEALVYNLAYRLAPKYSFPMQERAWLGVEASTMKQKVMSFDREFGSVYFQPDTTRGNNGFPSY